MVHEKKTTIVIDHPKTVVHAYVAQSGNDKNNVLVEQGRRSMKRLMEELKPQQEDQQKKSSPKNGSALENSVTELNSKNNKVLPRHIAQPNKQALKEGSTNKSVRSETDKFLTKPLQTEKETISTQKKSLTQKEWLTGWFIAISVAAAVAFLPQLPAAIVVITALPILVQFAFRYSKSNNEHAKSVRASWSAIKPSSTGNENKQVNVNNPISQLSSQDIPVENTCNTNTVLTQTSLFTHQEKSAEDSSSIAPDSTPTTASLKM